MRGPLAVLTILLVSLLTPTIFAADTVTTGNVVMEGEVTLTGNYTISKDTELLIKPGTVIDAQNYWIRVNGTLTASNAIINSSLTSSTQGGHNAGMWTGIIIEPTGEANLQNVTVANAETAIVVDGQLTAGNLTLEDNLRGISIDGSAEITDFFANRTDNEMILVTGTLTIQDYSGTNASTGISNVGTLSATDGSFQDVGTGFDIQSGDANILRSSTTNTSTGYRVGPTANLEVHSSQNTQTTLIFDISSGGILNASNMISSGDQLLRAAALNKANLSDVVFNHDIAESATSIGPAIDAQVSNSLGLSEVDLLATSIGMDLSGSGVTTISDVMINSSDYGIATNGDGTIVASDLTINFAGSAISASGTSIALSNTVLNGSVGALSGIDATSSTLSLASVGIQKPVLGAGDSTALNLWWSQADAGELTISGYADGITLDTSHLSTSNLTVVDQVNTGIELINSELSTKFDLLTRGADDGVNLVGQSTLHTSGWECGFHEQALSIDTDSLATVRDWEVGVISGTYGAMGDGTFYYGGTGTSAVSVTTSAELMETTITVTDLDGTPLQSSVSSHGFNEESDASGVVTVPMLSSGSQVSASYQGTGTAKTLTGGTNGQSLQIPLIPEGNWVISSGVVAVLSAKIDDTPHTLSGNITIQPTAMLVLDGTELELGSNRKLTIQSGGSLKGMAGTISGGIVKTAGTNTLISGDGGLYIESELDHQCGASDDVTRIHIRGELTLGPSCDLKITGGSGPTSVNTEPGSSLELISTLEITVLNRGEPVQGATVVVGGISGPTTDSQGQITISNRSRYVDNNGEEIGGRITITVPSLGVDPHSWDTAHNSQHTFVASTLDSGSISGWTVLEKAWSPYFLEGDLTIPVAATLTINDGVHLKVGDSSSIIVQGTLEAGLASITASGSSWDGISIGGPEAKLSLTGTYVSGALSAIVQDAGATIDISNAHISNSGASHPLIELSSSAYGSLDIESTLIEDAGSQCIFTQGSGTISISSSTLNTCGDTAIWGIGADIALESVIVGAGSTEGIILSGGQLAIKGLQSSEFNGSGDMLGIGVNEGLELSGLTLNGDVTLQSVEHLSILNSEITGRLLLDASSGEISNTNITSTEEGIVVLNPKYSSAIILDGVVINAGGEALLAESESEAATIQIYSSSITGMGAIETIGVDFEIEDSTLSGLISATNSNVVLVDCTSEDIKTAGQGTVTKKSTHLLNPVLDGVSQSATMTIRIAFEIPWTSTLTGQSIEVELPYSYSNELGTTTRSSAILEASSANSHDYQGTIAFGPETPSTISIVLTANQAPTIAITSPDEGARYMEGETIPLASTITDDVETGQTIEWKILDLVGIQVGSSLTTESGNASISVAGWYEVRLIVTDNLGASSERTVSIQITQLDSDSDWLQTCDENEWYDNTNHVDCGPDEQDADDDNDGFEDGRDAFPFDPCANADDDGDGMPNVIKCPDGVTTDLLEDQDDDGDGKLDSISSESAEEEGMSITAIILIIAFIIGASALLLKSRRNQY